MARVHLFEFEDQPWLPDVIRTAITGYLRLVAELCGQAAKIAPILERAVDRSGATEFVDLGSGGGGPTPASFRALHKMRPELKLRLTDLHPDAAALRHVTSGIPDAVRVEDNPVDATRVPKTLKGVRTLMNMLHHLRAEQARAVLQDAVDAGQPVVVVELLRRHPLVVLSCFFSFFLIALSVPFLRPFRWPWLFWTFVIPVIPSAGAWDGIVSSLRVYSEEELRALVDSLEAGSSYEWEFGTAELPPSPVPGSYLIGAPRRH